MSILHVPDDLAARLAVQAARRGMTVDELAAEILQARFPDTGIDPAPDPLEAFIGSGRSGRGDLARSHRQVLADTLALRSGGDT